MRRRPGLPGSPHTARDVRLQLEFRAEPSPRSDSQRRPSRRWAWCSASSLSAPSLASCRHVALSVADPAVVPRQLAEVDLVRAPLGVPAVAAVAGQAVLEGLGHPSSIEHKFDSVHNRQPISDVSGTGLILPAL